jgi:hypothetical protein
VPLKVPPSIETLVSRKVGAFLTGLEDTFRHGINSAGGAIGRLAAKLKELSKVEIGQFLWLEHFADLSARISMKTETVLPVGNQRLFGCEDGSVLQGPTVLHASG